MDTAAEPPLGASLSGPGPADAVVRECAVMPEKSGDAVAAVEVVCAARTAGDYVLSVFHMETGERLFGSPFAVRAGLSYQFATQYKNIPELDGMHIDPENLTLSNVKQNYVRLLTETDEMQLACNAPLNT